MLRSSAIAGLILACTSVASAQLPEPPTSPSETEVSAGRAAFLEGIGHARAERWEPAREAFERSYTLSGSPVALFNLASTDATLGRHQLALAAFDRLLALPDLDAETRERASALRATSAARVGVITIRGIPDGDARVTADGRLREVTPRRPVELVIDPGPHVLAIGMPGAEPWTWTGDVAPGAILDLEASLVLPEAPPERVEGADPLPWILVGAAAALVVGAVVTGVVADQSAQLQPRTELVLDL
ncbi:MAG: hypothetical protein EVA89_37045 [Sandaracinaceae bacterium]|nr:MAG: hypothetical protein EVA89_37045 [Sandaracinaceae bacterium]